MGIGNCEGKSQQDKENFYSWRNTQWELETIKQRGTISPPDYRWRNTQWELETESGLPQSGCSKNVGEIPNGNWKHSIIETTTARAIASWRNTQWELETRLPSRVRK